MTADLSIAAHDHRRTAPGKRLRRCAAGTQFVGQQREKFVIATIDFVLNAFRAPALGGVAQHVAKGRSNRY
jgi:hypothetical protein